jgi:hypothetical protein
MIATIEAQAKNENFDTKKGKHLSYRLDVSGQKLTQY